MKKYKSENQVAKEYLKSKIETSLINYQKI